ncbi:MAG: DJ-1/PfpI family protein, partial [Kutzneria sp.]|nr:DJ-1/PfpI family protein [Kutzneria sp.]
MHHVAVLVLPGAVAFDVAVPSQVFGHPDEHGRYRLTVCGVRAGAASTTTGFTIGVRYGLQTLVKADTVVVAGFRPYDDPQADALRALRRAAARGARMVSICTGAFALAAAGLLDGRPATTHWRDAPCLAAWFPAVDVRPDELYVDDGDVLTSA